ncbi:MAG: LON peptidase substrate-binding domain-containing protein [Methylophilaceae bacterium]
MNTYPLPLFPLNLVVFPEGILSLKIFETRYLDMVRECLRNKSAFGVVMMSVEGDDNSKATYPFSVTGTSVTILEADVPQTGLMMIRCLGQQRFRVQSAKQQANGLWMGEAEDIENDTELQIPEDMQLTKLYLRQMIDSFVIQGVSASQMPFVKPYKLDDCAWVANRWSEILPIPLPQKQRLLELDSPLVRLELIHDILNANTTEN